MAFAPSNQFTAFEVLSMTRELGKVIDISKVLDKQGKLFYQLSLLEIVTLLNGATEKAYSSYIDAVHYHASDTASETEDQYKLKVEDDIFQIPVLHPRTNLLSINLLQKRFTGTGDNGYIWDPCGNKFIDKITNIEHRIEFHVAAPTDPAPPSDSRRVVGKLAHVDPADMLSIYRQDFPHGSYSNEIVWSEFGSSRGALAVKCQSVASTAAKIGLEESYREYDHLPLGITLNSYKFPSYYIRLRVDPNNADLLKAFRGGYQEAEKLWRTIYTIWYQRMPNFPVEAAVPTTSNDGWQPNSTHPSRFVDLPDKHIPLLVKRIYTYCLIQLNQSVPDQLSQDMKADYQQIYAMMDSETRNQLQGKIPQQLGGR